MSDDWRVDPDDLIHRELVDTFEHVDWLVANGHSDDVVSYWMRFEGVWYEREVQAFEKRVVFRMTATDADGAIINQYAAGLFYTGLWVAFLGPGDEFTPFEQGAQICATPPDLPPPTMRASDNDYTATLNARHDYDHTLEILTLPDE